MEGFQQERAGYHLAFGRMSKLDRDHPFKT